MGLHTTPYGSFYVQRDLKTGEIIQVLPVEPSDTPSQLPSVGALGIDDNFIQSRRATFEANSSRASDSQGRLQRELATVGGRRLLETGRAVIAQRDGDMVYAQGQAPGQAPGQSSSSAAAAAPAQPRYPYSSMSSAASSSAPSHHDHRDHRDHRDSRSSSSSHRHRGGGGGGGSAMNYTLSEDLHHHHGPSSHLHSVRPWPESLTHEHVVTRPPPPQLPQLPAFQAIDSPPRAAAVPPSHEDEARRHDERGSSSVSTTSTSMSMSRSSSSRGSRGSRGSRSSSRHHQQQNHQQQNHHHRSQRCQSTSTAISISSMVTDSEGGSGSGSGSGSASEACTPAAVSPRLLDEGYFCSSSSSYVPAQYYYPGCAAALPTVEPDAPARINNYTRALGRSTSSSSPPPPPPPPLPAPSFTSPTTAAAAPTAAPAAPKQKTVWITWTLEPRRAAAPNGSDCNDYAPQRVRTHMETHMTL